MFPQKHLECIIYTCLSIAVVKCSLVKKDSYPKIEDIISFSDKKVDLQVPSNVVAKNFSIDIEKLDMRKFRRNQGAYMKQILGDITLDRNISLKNESRRQYYGVPYHNSPWYMGLAIDRQTYTKIADTMLQTIYMARHKIKLLERKASFSKETIAYRVAFLYEKLRVLAKKVNSIYTTMYNHRPWLNAYQTGVVPEWFIDTDWKFILPMLQLHHKMAKVHVDFLYVYWVFLKMYKIYATNSKIPNTTPKEY